MLLLLRFVDYFWELCRPGPLEGFPKRIFGIILVRDFFRPDALPVTQLLHDPKRKQK